MGFLGRLCVLLFSIVIIIVCFALGIVTLFIASTGPEAEISLMWSKVTPVDGSCDPKMPQTCNTYYCNANAFGKETKEYRVMVAMVSLGFAFLTLFLLFTPCLLIDKLSKHGMAMCGCAGGCGFLAWVFYLVAWAYWVANDPCKTEAIRTLAGGNRTHSYETGFSACVTLWCLLTLALPGVCGGARMKGKEKGGGPPSASAEV